MSLATVLPSVTTNSATAQTSRCRQRRQITSTASVAHHKASIPSGAGFESTPAARAAWVSQGVRIPSNALRTAWSTTSAATAACCTLPISTPATTATPISSSQRLPEVCSCRGSGGGSPDGRRRRRTRVAVPWTPRERAAGVRRAPRRRRTGWRRSRRLRRPLVERAEDEVRGPADRGKRPLPRPTCLHLGPPLPDACASSIAAPRGIAVPRVEGRCVCCPRALSGSLVHRQ